MPNKDNVIDLALSRQRISPDSQDQKKAARAAEMKEQFRQSREDSLLSKAGSRAEKRRLSRLFSKKKD